MDIIQLKNDLNFDFSDDKDLLEKLKKMYTLNGYTANVRIDGNIIHIHVDEKAFKSISKDFERAMALCNNNDFDKAEPILRQIVDRCPFHADAYRTLAQIKMSKGKFQEAYDQNIEALKVDPTNLWALILMGNICTHMGQIETADTYYNKVLEYHPDNSLALNNIGANYIKRGEYDKAIELFDKVLKVDKTYLNTYYGLALCYYNKKDLQKTLDICIDGMKQGVNRPQDRGIREEIQKLAMTTAHEMTDHFDFSIEIGMEKQKLSKMTDVPLRIEEDANLNTHARLEYYISRHRDYNRVVVNPTKQYHVHLMMHEFMHLEMSIEASRNGKNMIVVSDAKDTDAFRKWIASEMRPLKSRLSESGYEQLLRQLHEGLMLQATNSALDLLVEDRIYDLYPKMRPLQMLSLVEMEIGNVDSVTKASKTDLPKKVVSANRIMISLVPFTCRRCTDLTSRPITRQTISRCVKPRISTRSTRLTRMTTSQARSMN